jgi:tripartite-type tricarboxylate transporter receptor subunit TctC
MHMPGVLDRFAADGPVAMTCTPEQFAAYIKSEQAKWSKVVRAANIKVE